jgi:hypothetical protein
MGSSAASSFARIFLSDEIECLTGLRKATSSGFLVVREQTWGERCTVIDAGYKEMT